MKSCSRLWLLTLLCVLAAPIDAISQPSGVQRNINGHFVEVRQSNNGMSDLYVDRQRLTKSGDSQFISVHGPYVGGGRTYILAEEATGGHACVALYQIVDLSFDKPSISPTFGTCSDLAVAVIQGNALRVSVPAFGAAAAQTVTYANGIFKK